MFVTIYLIRTHKIYKASTLVYDTIWSFIKNLVDDWEFAGIFWSFPEFPGVSRIFPEFPVMRGFRKSPEFPGVSRSFPELPGASQSCSEFPGAS